MELTIGTTFLKKPHIIQDNRRSSGEGDSYRTEQFDMLPSVVGTRKPANTSRYCIMLPLDNPRYAIKMSPFAPGLREFIISSSISCCSNSFSCCSPSYVYLSCDRTIEEQKPRLITRMRRGEPHTDWMVSCAQNSKHHLYAEQLMLEVCKTLYTLSLNRLRHGDVKPANILLMLTGNIVRFALIDYNTSHSTLNTIYTHTATINYRSPEENAKVPMFTDTSDMWSLGITLIEFLGYRGHAKVTTPQGLEVFHKLIQTDLSDSTTWLSKKLSHLDAFGVHIRAMLSLDPKKRPLPVHILQDYNRPLRCIRNQESLLSEIPRAESPTTKQRLEQPVTAPLAALLTLQPVQIKLITDPIFVFFMCMICKNLSTEEIKAWKNEIIALALIFTVVNPMLVTYDIAQLFALCVRLKFTLNFACLPQLSKEARERIRDCWCSTNRIAVKKMVLVYFVVLFFSVSSSSISTRIVEALAAEVKPFIEKEITSFGYGGVCSSLQE